MSQQVRDSRDPAVVALCLDWLHNSMPWPKAPRGPAAASASGFVRPHGARSASSWRECEQCGGTGSTRRGPCTNCEGSGGWHYDPMDAARAALRTSEDAHPNIFPSSKPDPVRTVRLSSTTTREEIERELGQLLPYPLRLLVDALAELRRQDREQRAILQRVHILRVDPYLRPAELVLYHAALVHLADLLPANFRAPRRYRYGVHGAPSEPRLALQATWRSSRGV